MTARVVELYFDSTVEPFRASGFHAGEVMEALKGLRGRGIGVKVTDTAFWDGGMIREVYGEVLRCAAGRGYRVAALFGGGGRFFGRQVPALLVREGGSVVDVYPHECGGRMETPIAFLRSILSGGGER